MGRFGQVSVVALLLVLLLGELLAKPLNKEEGNWKARRREIRAQRRKARRQQRLLDKLEEVVEEKILDLGDNPEYGEYLEGDIEEDEDIFESEPPGLLNAVTNERRKWPNGIVPFTIGEGYTQRQQRKILGALRDIEERTKVDGRPCIQFREKTDDDEDYVLVNRRTGCTSFVGRKHGMQKVNLGPNCVRSKGIIQHEFLHALGFHHEQKRADRDHHVTVVWDNIRQGRFGNFKKLREGASVDHLGTPYDYGSVMHYGAKAFAQDRSRPTIITPNGEQIGQRRGISEMDAERVQIFYGCLSPADSKNFKNLAKVSKKMYIGG